ncbi:ABC transporter substrate-binding protein [Ramlibacter tataouinensis]|uniref:Candidate ABC type nitrate/sulfonate/bicarbonate transport system, periplasmic component n=1 Tax=Ramlibacter tataouinensis (strain ATCC BAA-407 / DSM 14655 / LMG 21543 / TTB310) TaxID=365046 RepID=F5Y4I1_RAMTT|nr:ABC transporter substrate-binding protein [Ramlibacter tataouinensis]AEG93828.1 candidate ABC type nitrate/sulfonate/bicarbonate transport system, periplasmic component [Ramlibacter tataouinensis TTB310]
MFRRTRNALLSLAVAAASASAMAQPLQEIRVSSQPALYGSVPFLVAQEKDWWREVGLKVTITNFPAGAPQIAASRSWDVGYTGSVPAVLGAVRFGLHTIALSDDQSAANALMVRGPNAALPARTAPWLKGGTILLTANSTVDLVARACLRKLRLEPKEVTLRSMGQPEVVAAMASGSGEVGGLWAPNTYTAEEKAGARVLCSGKDAGVLVPGNLVVRADWAQQNPQAVAKFLAVYLRAQRWLAANRKEALAVMKRHYEAGGVQISEASMNKELDTRPTFNLGQQLALFDRTERAASEVDNAMNAISYFMRTVGTLRPDEPMPDPRTYVTDRYLRLIDADPELKGFARRTQ